VDRVHLVHLGEVGRAGTKPAGAGAVAWVWRSMFPVPYAAARAAGTAAPEPHLAR
jgi:hypothetical protein